MDKKHRMAANRQIRQVHKHSSNVKKIKVDQSLFQSNTLSMTEEEEREIREAKEKLEKLQTEAAKNDAEMNQVLEQNRKKAELRKKHESYREKSIKKREGKKAKFRQMAKQFWGTVKIILGVLGFVCAVIGITAVLGCEYQLDSLKDLPLCHFGKNPNNDDGDRRLESHRHPPSDANRYVRRGHAIEIDRSK
eukprot:g2318.t1